MKRLVLATVGIAGIVVGAQVTAKADTSSNGCPTGYQLLSVATLTSEGYRVAAEVDSPTSGVLSYGQPGNGDGSVCGVRLGNRLTHFGLPFFNFIDDTLPASE